MYIYHYFPQDVCAIDQPLVQEHQQLIFHNRMPIDEEILLTGVQEGFHVKHIHLTC